MAQVGHYRNVPGPPRTVQGLCTVASSDTRLISLAGLPTTMAWASHFRDHSAGTYYCTVADLHTR